MGREQELELVRSALKAGVLPFQALYMYGPGGVGKTSFLFEVSYLCHEAGASAVYLDGRTIEASPDGLYATLRGALGLPANEDPLQAIAHATGRRLVLLDTYEKLQPLDTWLSEVFLRELPENAVLIVAGRNPPSLAWRRQPGWQSMIQALPLRNLGPVESRAYLSKRSIPQEQHLAVLQFTHGHPLALSLVADTYAQRPGFQFRPEEAPDVVRLLLELLVQQVPGQAHRAALEACAIVKFTTEDLLAQMLEVQQGHDLFEWLRGLSFIESGPLGLFPHDLAREVLAADVRWRNPDWYAELHRRARGHYLARIQKGQRHEQQLALIDYIFLHRDNAVVRPFFQSQERGGSLADTMRAGDVPLLVEMVARHEGEASARIAERWLARQPQGALVFRDAEHQPLGFLLTVALHQASPEDLQGDPGAQAAMRYLEQRAPLRPGEASSIFRFWMARDTYQGVSHVQSMAFVNMVRHYLTTASLAFTFIPCSQPELWAAVFAYAELQRLPEADFQVDGRTYGVYGHDWRAMPPLAWLDLLAQREVAAAPQAAPPPPATLSLVVLSQADFAAAVRDALGRMARPSTLEGNPLLRSRLVVSRAGADVGKDARVAALQALLTETVELMGASPKEQRYHQALYHTYVKPTPSQEKAAELVDVPYSSFRRHLKEGIVRVTDVLWHHEIGAGEQ